MRAHPAETAPGLGPGRLLLIIVTACLLLANLYYPQPILHEAADALGLPGDAAGALITAGQLGYIAGLLLVAPLGDVLDNRRLCAAMTAGAGLCACRLAGRVRAALSRAHAAHGRVRHDHPGAGGIRHSLAGPGRSGKILGIMAAGLFLGIALSRPVASLMAGAAGWRTVYLGSGLVLLGVGLCLYALLPERRGGRRAPGTFAVLRSMARLLRFPLLLRRSAVSAGAFFSFSMFWSAMPLALAGHPEATQGGITLFTLAGLVTPPCMLLVSKLLDRGKGRKILLTALGCGILAWLLPLAGSAWLGIFFAAALLLDPASSAVTVTVQQRILAEAPAEARGRLNSLNISMNFLGGAAGAALGPWLLAHLGPRAVTLTGALLLVCLLRSVTASR